MSEVLVAEPLKYLFFLVAARPEALNATSDGNSTVVVSWTTRQSGSRIRIFFEHPEMSTYVIISNMSNYSFSESNYSDRVYSVSIQALSEHLPSEIVGPVTVRGQSLYVCPNYHSTLHKFHYSYMYIHVVPSHIQDLRVVGMERKLNISWEEPSEPNSHTLNYTVTIRNISVNSLLNSTVVDTYPLTILSQMLRKYALYHITVNFSWRANFSIFTFEEFMSIIP